MSECNKNNFLKDKPSIRVCQPPGGVSHLVIGDPSIDKKKKLKLYPLKKKAEKKKAKQK